MTMIVREVAAVISLAVFVASIAMFSDIVTTLA